MPYPGDFSIIIPACQEQSYIESTLLSLWGSAEIIVVCNGCTDSTALIAKKYAKVIVIKERNVSRARNIGAKKSRGSMLIFLDADTRFSSQDILKKIEASLKHSVVGTCKVLPDKPKLKYKIATWLKNKLLFTHWTTGIIFCSRNTFIKTKGFNEQLGKKEDRDFVNRCLKYGKFGVADCYVINSMRRYEKKGILRHAFYWVKETIKPTKEEYEIIR